MRTLLHNALIVNEGVTSRGYIAIEAPYIVEVGTGDAPGRMFDWAEVAVDCDGDMLMPGAIDTHVHMREPGLTSKGDIASETHAARTGGVTSVIDMPNVKPATVTREAWEEKMALAASKSEVNYAFFVGATGDNIPALRQLDYTRVPGIKLFLGSSTGNMLLDNDAMLADLLTGAPALIAVHAEDESTICQSREALQNEFQGQPIPVHMHHRLRPSEACVKATKRIVGLALEHHARLHLLHVSTADEIEYIESLTASERALVTVETCPHYLYFTHDDLVAHGARLKCNPAIKSDSDRQELLKALRGGVIDTVATDHAPHLPADKEGDLLKAASGMPGVQFSVPLMLGVEGIEPRDVAKLMSHRPAEIFRIDRRGFLRAGYYADIIRVKKLEKPDIISDKDVVSRCGWTPYDGIPVNYKIVTTWINGHTRRHMPMPLVFNN